MRLISTQSIAAPTAFFALAATVAFAADLPVERPSGHVIGSLSAPVHGTSLDRRALRPVPREWILADAGAVVDARELVVLAPDEAAAEAMIGMAQPLGYSVRRQDVLGGLGQVVVVLEIPAARSGPEAIQEIEALQPRVTAGVNHAYAVPGGSQALERFRFADAMIGWPIAGCEAFARVGLVDTGIDTAASRELDGRVTTADFRRAPGEQMGTDHGTALALLLGGPGRLIEPQIYNAVVAGDGHALEQSAGVDDLLRALDWLAREDVRVVNISLAGPYNKILDLGVQSAAARGLVMVAAAGNDGPSSIPRYPAAFDEVVAVTAVDADQDVYARAVRGPHIDFAAPGVDVMVPVGAQPRFVSGTSVAAPFVTAMLAADPRILGPNDPADIVADYGRTARDVGETGRDDVFGFGILLAEDNCS